MLIKTRGIIFRSVKYSETSLIVDIYTEEKGLRSYIVSGVRSKNARIKASTLQVMSLVDLVVYHREDKTLTRIKEVQSAYVYRSTPFHLIKGTIGLFMIELTRKTVREEAEQNLPLFNFLFESFSILDRTEEPVSNFHLSFMLQLSGFLGFMPGGEYSKLTPIFDLEEGIFVPTAPGHPHFLSAEQSQIFDALLQFPPEQSHQIKISRDVRKVMLRELLHFFRLHLEQLPEINAHQILEVVLE